MHNPNFPQSIHPDLGTVDDRGRRQVLRAGLVGLGIALTPRMVWAEVAKAPPPPSAALRLLEVVSDLVIPVTSMPGALAARVPQFAVLAIQHNCFHARGDEMTRLQRQLDRLGGKPFLGLPRERQFTILSMLDRKSFLPHTDTMSAWRIVKATIVNGYYSSEIGGSQDQKYELVPGRYDGNVVLHPGDAAYSSDWTGNAFS